MPEGVSKEINPQVYDQTIGIVDLRKIKIYPLAVGHQLELSDLINEAVAAFVSMDLDEGNEGMVQFVSFAIGLIKKNISKITKYITKEDEDILMDMSNLQLSEIVEKVYKVNFEEPIKAVMNLFQIPEEKSQNQQSSKFVQRSVRRTATS